MVKEMLNVLALGAHPELRSLKKELNELDISLDISYFSSVRIEIINNQTQIYVADRDICEYDFVWIKSPWNNRPFANAITVHLDARKIPHTEVEVERSKLVDNVHFAENNVNLPNTFYCVTKRMADNIEHIERVCSYPVIIKVTRGSLGEGIFLAKKRSELKHIIEYKLGKAKKYICQEFIPNDYDYRIIVSGQDRILSAEKRIRQEGEFRNNA